MYAYRKLRATLDEYTTRVGQQAIVLCISPSKPNPVFKVFGAAPLENVVRVTYNTNYKKTQTNLSNYRIAVNTFEHSTEMRYHNCMSSR